MIGCAAGISARSEPMPLRGLAAVEMRKRNISLWGRLRKSTGIARPTDVHHAGDGMAFTAVLPLKSVMISPISARSQRCARSCW